MKILFNCNVPFSLAHGGVQIQIEQTKTALENMAVEVEPLRWWDGEQGGDILHHFGRIPQTLLHLARQKGIKVVFSDLLTGTGSRSAGQLCLQRVVTRFLRRATRDFSPFNWNSYRDADACIALTPWEAHLMAYIFEAPPDKVYVIPNGVEEIFLKSAPALRGNWLVCTTTITERKRAFELAEAAALAKTPLWVIGKPYSADDPYAQRLVRVAGENSQFIRYEGAIFDRARLAKIYREARGFVLLSSMESLSLSALEAAACECPLLLSDLPWARTTFREDASYCPIASALRTAPYLRRFYDAAPNLRPPPKPPTWIDVAQQLKGLYESVFKASR